MIVNQALISEGVETTKTAGKVVITKTEKIVETTKIERDNKDNRDS